jgi:hypothetical protein
MAEQFPNFTPSEREFAPGTYPVKTYRSLSGVSVKRSFGNKPTGHQLRLVFANVGDNVLNDILKHYADTFGGFDRFNVPNRVFAGMNDAAQNKMQRPDGIRWEYASPPSVQSVFNGISTITVDLVGEQSVG